MFLDHANRTLWTYQPWIMAIGRLAFPLFAFLIAYNTTIRGTPLHKYLLPLVVFGAVSQGPAMLALDRGLLPLNIFFTLLLGVSLLPLGRRVTTRLTIQKPFTWAFWLALGYLWLLLGFAVEYGPAGVFLIPAVQFLLTRPALVPALATASLLLSANGFSAASLVPLLLPLIVWGVSCLSPSPLPRLKWFFYAFYPLHLSVLWLLKQAI